MYNYICDCVLHVGQGEIEERREGGTGIVVFVIPLMCIIIIITCIIIFSVLYSWIGVEVGYMQSTLKSAQCLECNDGPRLIDDPFVLVVESIRKYHSRYDTDTHMYLSFYNNMSYCTSGFDCKILMIMNCEFFYYKRITKYL